MPSLIAKYQEQQTVTQVKKAYSVFSQAFNRAVAGNGPADTWDIGGYNTAAGSQKLYNILKPYLIKVKECNQASGCFADEYKSLTGEKYIFQPINDTSYVRGILNDGTSFTVASAGSGCNTSYGIEQYAHGCGGITVDINGYKKPNQVGKDYFGFTITKSGVFPIGGPNFQSPYNYICDIKTPSNRNGLPCTAWVIAKGNMDYLHKTISWE